MRKRKRANKYKKEDQLPLYIRIHIVAFIILLIYILSRSGGNWQGWYQGKPFHER